MQELGLDNNMGLHWMLVAVIGVLGLTITPTLTVPPPLKLTITPEHAHIFPGTDLNIMCKADAPLTHCQFKVRSNPVYDLSAGVHTPFENDYVYYGEGLENGDCGITLTGKALQYVVYVVGCRVRSSNSDWVFRETALINKRRDGMPVTVTPGWTLVVLPDEPITVLVDAHKPLTRCAFVLTNDFSKTNNNRRFGFNQDSVPDPKNPNNTGMEYYGAGVSKGQCGFQMLQAKQEHNDGAFMDVFDSEEHEETLFFRIIVARPPNAPTLAYNPTPNSDGTLHIDAMCSARSRPAGNITWYLGGEPIDAKFSQFVPTESWMWPSNVLQVQQRLTLDLGPENNGKDLWCAVEHIALRAPIESLKSKIEITIPPSPPILVVKSPYLSEGATIEASCTVNNWQPDAKVTWYLGAVVLRQDNKNDDTNGNGTYLTQRLSHLLKAYENGLELRCVVEHSALPKATEAMKKVHFTHCSPLISKSVLISCSLAGEQVDCAQPQQVGTIAQLACKPGYTVGAVYRRVTCLRAVKWDRPLFTCSPACGKRNTNSGTTLISGGEDSKIGEFPWHIGIYQMSSASEPQQTCGGTLISPNIVVSAAHCFWNNNFRKPKDPKTIRVAAGKHIRDWNDPDPNVQKRNVSEIIIPLRYSGRLSQFASDIALLRLSVELELTATVNLICIDWDNVMERSQLRLGRNGTVAGWGYTETGNQSPALKYVDLPYVSPEQCAKVLSDEVEPVFTHDKFCAGFVNRSISVCRGDSGGGLVFRHPGTDKYYLRGIVSIAFTGFAPKYKNATCYSQLYTGFTKLSMFLNWVQDNI